MLLGRGLRTEAAEGRGEESRPTGCKRKEVKTHQCESFHCGHFPNFLKKYTVALIEDFVSMTSCGLVWVCIIPSLILMFLFGSGTPFVLKCHTVKQTFGLKSQVQSQVTRLQTKG